MSARGPIWSPDVRYPAIGRAVRREAMGTVETSFERHYSVEELAEVWKLSPDFVRRLFLHEPGVVVFHRARSGRRVYRTIRIPESVAARVHRNLTRPD